MATGEVALSSEALRRRDLFLSPLDKVHKFFQALTELRQTADSSPEDKTWVLSACEKVSLCGEQVVLCLEQQIWQHNRAAETAQEVIGVFRLGLRRMVMLRRECAELKRYLKEMQLADRNIDATDIPPLLQEKQRKQREFTVPGGSAIPHAVSFEDLRRHRDHHLSSSKRSVDSFGGNIRRTRSDTDVALQSLKKKVEVCGESVLVHPLNKGHLGHIESVLYLEALLTQRQCTIILYQCEAEPSVGPFSEVPPVISVSFCLLQSLTVDNTKLRDSEKKLIKEKIKLTRQCKVKSESNTPVTLLFPSHIVLHTSPSPLIGTSYSTTSFYIPPSQMLEVERDRAEDRLKIEQTQRDSVERLRQRNKELEEQLRALCESQVLRERERAEQQQRKAEESNPDPTSDHHDNP
jgi:hypothetical protein